MVIPRVRRSERLRSYRTVVRPCHEEGALCLRLSARRLPLLNFFLTELREKAILHKLQHRCVCKIEGRQLGQHLHLGEARVVASAHPCGAAPPSIPGASTFAFKPVESGRCIRDGISRPLAETATRPPGFVTRTISASIRSASTSSMTVTDMVTSKVLSENGKDSALPSRNRSRPPDPLAEPTPWPLAIGTG